MGVRERRNYLKQATYETDQPNRRVICHDCANPARWAIFRHAELWYCADCFQELQKRMAHTYDVRAQIGY